MTVNSAAATIQAYFEALNWGRMEDGVDLFGDATQWEVTPFNTTFDGACGYLNYWGIWTRAAPQLWIEIESLKLAQNWGVARYFVRGVHRGLLETPLGTICPTGKEFNLPVTEVYDALAGRFVRLHTSFCLASLMSQLGRMPAANQAPVSMHLLN